MFEGKHIHFSPVDNKPLCSYSKKICKQRRLNGYAFCIRHILEDCSAPFKQCSFVAKFKKCTNPIPSHEERGYCNSHMQVVGMVPKKVRRPSKKSTEEPTRIWKSSPGHTTIILPSSDVGKLKFSDRLKALLKTGSTHSVNLEEEAMLEDEEDEGDCSNDQMDYDPYAFSEPEPFGKVMNFGEVGRLKSNSDGIKLGSALVQKCRVTPTSIASRKPIKYHSVDSGPNGHRSVIPAAIRPMPLGHNEGISLSAETSSETMNRLAAKIAADKVLGKHHRKFRPPLSKRSEETSESSPSHSSSSSSSSPHHKMSDPLHPSPGPPHLIHVAHLSTNSASGSSHLRRHQPAVHRRPSNTAHGSTSNLARRLPFPTSSPKSIASPPFLKSSARSLSHSAPQLAPLSANSSVQHKERSLLEEQLLGVKGIATARSRQSASDHSSPRKAVSNKGTSEISQHSPRGSRVKMELPPPQSPGSPSAATSSSSRRSRSSHRPITYRAPSNKSHQPQQQSGGLNASEVPSPSSNPSNIISIPNRRCRNGRGVLEVVKSISTSTLRNIQEIWEEMRLYKQDLYPLGLESSETEESDSEPECGFYQRHWFTPPFDCHISSSLCLSPNLSLNLKPRAKVKTLAAQTSSSSESRCLDDRRHDGPSSNHPASLANVGARGVAYDEWKARGFGKIPCHSENAKGSLKDEEKGPLSVRDQRLLRTREDLRRRCGQIGGACYLLGRRKAKGGTPKLEPGVKVKVEAGVDENLPLEGEAWQEQMVRAVIAAVRRSGPNRTGSFLRDGLRMQNGKKGQHRPHTRHRNRSKLTMLVTRACAYRYGDMGETAESGDDERKPEAGSSATKNNGYCGSPALPCTRHCPRHVMYNVDQLLFEHCTAKFADNTQCCAPVFDVSRDTPLCPEHARKRDNYDRMCAEIKPKRARKKAKPSAMTRPSKRGKKKRRSASVPSASVQPEDLKEEVFAQYSSPMSVAARRAELGKSTSLSPTRREILDDDGPKGSSRHLAVSLDLTGVPNKGDDEDDGDFDEEDEASALSGACLDEEEEEDEEEDEDAAALAAAAESLAVVDDDEEEECEGVVEEEEAIASVLGDDHHGVEVDGLPLLDPSEELGNQASRLLEEHDLTNVLNQIPPEAFNDLFIEGKNGEYEPTREETEELERALAAVDKDVKSLEKLSRQGAAGSSGSGVIVVGGAGNSEVVGSSSASAPTSLDLDSILDEHTLHQIATSGGQCSTSSVGGSVVGIPMSQMVVTSQGRLPANSICGNIPSLAGLPGGAENGAISGMATILSGEDGGGAGVAGLVPSMHVVNGATPEGGIAPLFCSQEPQNSSSVVHASNYDLMAPHLDPSVGQMAPVAGLGAYVTTIQSTTPSLPTPPSSSILAFNGGDGVLQPLVGSVAASYAPPQVVYAMTTGYPTNGYVVNNPLPSSQLVPVQKQHLLQQQQQNHFVPMAQSFEHFIGGNQMAVEVASGLKRHHEQHQVVGGPVDTLDLFGSGGIVDAVSLFASPTPGVVAPHTVVTTAATHETQLTSQQHQMLMMAAAAAESDTVVSEMGS